MSTRAAPVGTDLIAYAASWRADQVLLADDLRLRDAAAAVSPGAAQPAVPLS